MSHFFHLAPTGAPDIAMCLKVEVHPTFSLFIQLDAVVLTQDLFYSMASIQLDESRNSRNSRNLSQHSAMRQLPQLTQLNSHKFTMQLDKCIHATRCSC